MCINGIVQQSFVSDKWIWYQERLETSTTLSSLARGQLAVPVGTRVVSALLQDDSGVKVWAAVSRVSIPGRDCLLHLFTAEPGIQEESSYVWPCVFPVTVIIIHSPNLWTLPVGSMILDTEHTMMYKEDSLSITFYNNILDFLKSINV